MYGWLQCISIHWTMAGLISLRLREDFITRDLIAPWVVNVRRLGSFSVYSTCPCESLIIEPS
jgi:hypothetical protein